MVTSTAQNEKGVIESGTEGPLFMNTTTDTPTVEWGGVKYKIVTLKDGRTWMAENLRYIPEGMTVEADFTQNGDGIWYPVVAQLQDDGETYKAAVSTDASVIKSNGYLYTFATAAGVNEITAENWENLEGVQGICPDGWHIPTLAEFNALIAAYPLASNPAKADLELLKAADFPIPMTGMRMRNTSGLTGSVSGAVYNGALSSGYLMCSTGNQYKVAEDTGIITTQNKTLIPMHNASNNNAMISNCSNLAGIPVRCIQDLPAE